MGDEAAAGIHGGVHLNVDHKGTRSPLAAKFRIGNGHIELLAAGDVPLVPHGGAGHGTADANAHHKNPGQHRQGADVEFESWPPITARPTAAGTFARSSRAGAFAAIKGRFLAPGAITIPGATFVGVARVVAVGPGSPGPKGAFIRAGAAQMESGVRGSPMEKFWTRAAGL